MTRNIIIFLAALVALLGSGIAALGITSQRDTHLRGYVDPTQDANLPYRVPRLGVNAALEQYSPSELEIQLDLMQSAHVTWVRQVFPWSEIEPEPGVYDWRTWDAVVDAVEEQNDLHLIAVLYSAPAWARDERAPDHPTAPPQQLEAFARFAAQFAERYGDTVDYYQVWDEPNLRDAWGGLDPQPTAYASMLQTVYTAIHSADADATVITAALAPTTESGPHNLSGWLFLRELYALDAGDFFDAVGAKPYGFDHSPQDRTLDESLLNFSRVVLLREEMVRAGDGSKAIWASNWGWNSLPSDWTGEPSIWGQVNSETQVAYTISALERVEREWPWLAGMTLHHWQPSAPLDDPVWGFSLVNSQRESTPLLEALQAYTPAEVARNGLYAPNTPYAAYSGVWTFGDLGADVGWLSDSHLEFDFYGTDVALLLRQGDFTAYLYPELEAGDVNALPIDADGNPYIILTSPDLQPQVSLVPVARRLAKAEHTLRVTADRGWDQWVLVGYAVSSGNLAQPFNQQITLAWGVAALAILSVFVSGWRLPWRVMFSPVVSLWDRLSGLWQFAAGIIASGLLLLGVFLTWGGGVPALLKRDEIALGLSLFTAGLIYVEPGLILTIIAAIGLFFVVYHRIEFGLLLTVLWTPFFLFPVQLYLYAFPMAEVMVLLTFGAWTLRQMVQWAQRYHETRIIQPRLPRLSAIDWGVAAYVLLGAVSLLWTEYRDPALTELRVMFIEPALFYLVFRAAIKTKHQLTWIIDALLAATLIASVIGLFMYLAGQNVITAEGDARRLAGVYGSPNNVALFLGRVIPFALAYALLYRPRRWYGAAVLSVTLLTFALTQSVGGLFIGLPASVVAVLLLAFRRKALLPLAGLVTLSGATFAILSRFPRFGGVLDFTSGTNFRRLRVWQSGIEVVQDYPLTGLGLDQFLYAFRSQYIKPDAWQEPDLSHPHNFILDFWIRLGVAGVVLFVLLQIAFWRRLWQVYRNAQPTTLTYALVIACAGAMVNLLAHGLIDNSVFVNDLAIIFVLLLAVPQHLK